MGLIEYPLHYIHTQSNIILFVQTDHLDIQFQFSDKKDFFSVSEVGISFEAGSSFKLGTHFEVGARSEVGTSFEVCASCEVGTRFEIG